ncbi:MFS transporter [Nocardia sp. NBC_01503]|uniref:MFS transporter n=1 Tax=Nocardia sp. NBC_01503 TaxID=2975997 RepID=UPI002E7B9772|nr:MFS transporter [Nocardia sp. NBC_01503]WTL29814.1 MFS transporter [Nocardia sp. NBC_01503]
MRKWLPLFAACLGTLMLLIDVTIVNVALPDMAADLGAGLSGLQWIVDGYALALAALLLVLGSLADRLGAKPVYLAGLTLFAISSLVCGSAADTSILIVARVFQGIGGAAMFATTLSLLHATYTGRDRGIAFGAWGAVGGAAAALGVVLGGVLTDLLSWRWIFLVNLPIAALTIALSISVFPASQRRSGHRVDLPGMLAFTVAATGVTFGIIRGGEHGWDDGGALAALCLGLAAAALFAVIESRGPAPMFPLSLLRNRTFAATLLGASGQTFSAFAASPLISLWLRQQLHMSPLSTGLALLPMAATAFLVAGATGRFLHDAAAKWTIGAGLIVIAVGAGLLTMVDTGSSWTALIPGLVVIGAGAGVNAPALVSTAMAAVPVQQSGTAAGAVNTARQLGLALGIAILGTVFRGTAGDGRPIPLTHFVDGIDTAFTVACVVGLIFGAVSFALFHRARAQVAPISAQPALVD